jgi:hypothetical protein
MPRASNSLPRTLNTLTAVRAFLGWRGKVFESERKERRHAGAKEFDDEAQYPSVFGASSHTKVAANEVLDIIEAEGGPELRDVMFATCALDETVAEYVAPP